MEISESFKKEMNESVGKRHIHRLLFLYIFFVGKGIILNKSNVIL